MNIFAATLAAENDLNFFWTTTAGGAIKGLLAALGIMVVLVAIFKAFKHVSTGKPGDAAKVVIGAAVLAVFMFNPEMLTSLVTLIGDIISKFIDGGSEVVNQEPAG